MQAAWPGFAEDDAANTMWVTIISRSDASIGAQACKALVGHLKFKPTIADWNEAKNAAYRHMEPGETRRELEGGAQAELGGAAPLEANVAKRVNAEFKKARADRAKRMASMTADEFIVSEGHDPSTHRLSKSGYVLRIPPPRMTPNYKPPKA
jgi:hypothetical protein